MRIKQFKDIGVFTIWLGIYFFLLILSGMSLGNFFGSILRIVAFIPVFIWLFEKHILIFTNQIKLTFLFLFSCAITVFWTINLNSSTSRIISHSLFLILLVAVSSYDYSEKELSFLKKCLINSSRLSVVFVLINSSYFAGRLILNNSIMREDPNNLCAYFLFGLSMSLITMLNKKEKINNRVFSVIETIIYIYVVFLTGSRGGALAIISTSLIVFFFNKGLMRNIWRKIISIALILLLSYYYVLPSLSSTLIGRFSMENILESNGTGRFDLWLEGFELFKESSLFRQLFGYGTGTATSIIYGYTVLRIAVFHNIFVETLLETGIIGLIAYILHIGSFVMLSIKKRDIFLISIIIGMIVLSLSLSLYSFKPYWNILLFIVCCSREKNENTNNC